jgi:hypothetical protein
MANYATYTEVALILGLTDYTATTRPTSTQVTNILTEVTQNIDFTLESVGLESQPSDSNVQGRLKTLCKYGTACQIAISKYGDADGVESSQGAYFCKRYDEGIKEIKTNPELYGLVVGDSGSTANSNVLEGTDSVTDIQADYVDRTFTV